MSTYCGANCKDCTFYSSCAGCKQTCGSPFGGKCVLANAYKSGGDGAMHACKQRLIDEFNALAIKDMPTVTQLFALNGSFVNLQYTLPSGQVASFLSDKDVYLGNQLPKQDGSNLCYGIVGCEDFLLVCKYGEGGQDAQLVVYKRR